MGKNQLFFSANELGAKFRVSPETIRNLAKRGMLPYTKVGRQYRISRQAVESLGRSRSGPK